MASNNPPPQLADLIKTQRAQPGYSLQQPFYNDPAIYRYDMERVFFADWVFVCHASQLAEVGDTQTFDMDKESVIVCRDETMQIQAFANVCRHRGARICAAGASNNKRFVCPYHAWAYSLDGKLAAARMMPEGFDKATHGLKKIHVEEFCGFIFINMAVHPASFEGVKNRLSRSVEVFELDNLRLAHYESHPIEANWKLVYENYYQCYHCSPAHREYAASHSLSLDETRRAAHMEKLEKRATEAGISTETVTGFADWDHSQPQYYYHRYALYDGYETGSEDGKPVAPLLGQVKNWDGGASDLQLGNLTSLLIYADHVVLYRFTPRSVGLTDAELFWFVRGDAKDEDVDLERMSWLWNVTTIADKAIVERNQQGVSSRYYQPGPYSLMEPAVSGLVEWYLDRIEG